jgi:hypothetical protein
MIVEVRGRGEMDSDGLAKGNGWLSIPSGTRWLAVLDGLVTGVIQRRPCGDNDSQ